MTIRPRKTNNDIFDKAMLALFTFAVVAWPFGLLMNVIVNFTWLTLAWTAPVLALTAAVYAVAKDA